VTRNLRPFSHVTRLHPSSTGFLSDLRDGWRCTYAFPERSNFVISLPDLMKHGHPVPFFVAGFLTLRRSPISLDSLLFLTFCLFSLPFTELGPTQQVPVIDFFYADGDRRDGDNRGSGSGMGLNAFGLRLFWETRCFSWLPFSGIDGVLVLSKRSRVSNSFQTWL